jgi:hypothetical protein
MRHHGEVAGTCIHGYAPGTCLICRTLDEPKGAKLPTAAKARPGRNLAAQAVGDVPARSARRTAVRTEASGPRVVPKEAPRAGSPTMLKLAALTIAVILVIVVAWTVLHLVLVVLHILELIGVALVAGYLGWVAGVHHGHRTAGKN